MSPREQALSDEHFDGVPVREVPPDWQAPFQPWVHEDEHVTIGWWAWQPEKDAFTPVYTRSR